LGGLALVAEVAQEWVRESQEDGSCGWMFGMFLGELGVIVLA
jgi:hypothetical protein